MEIRLNLALLGAIGLAWAALTAGHPVAALDPAAAATHELARLEDDFARDRSNLGLARLLSSRYLGLHRPGLAVSILRAADPELLEDPMLMHHLAQAYEQSGRVLDALATADLALARCGRTLGTADASSVTPVPRYACGERDYAILQVHRRAVERMVRWGVADPVHDARARVAYDMAMRRATVASAQL